MTKYLQSDLFKVNVYLSKSLSNKTFGEQFFSLQFQDLKLVLMNLDLFVLSYCHGFYHCKSPTLNHHLPRSRGIFFKVKEHEQQRTRCRLTQVKKIWTSKGGIMLVVVFWSTTKKCFYSCQVASKRTGFGNSLIFLR